MFLSRHHNAGQDHDIKIAYRCLKNVAQFKYLGTAVTKQNLIQGEIKSRINLGNASYHLAIKLYKNIKIRTSSLLSKNIRI
jgi:hypothetical protein